MLRLIVPLTLLFSCSAKEEEPVDYDAMVMVEEEWTSGPDDHGLITDLTPVPQEMVIIETQ